MPKLKVKKAVSKRFKVTPTGKVMSGKSFGRHLKQVKSKSQKRRHKIPKLINANIAKKIKKLLGVA